MTGPTWIRRGFPAIGFVLATSFLVALTPSSMRSAKLCPDFIQFWTAATLITSGQDPYNPALQAAIHRNLGWSRETNGLGLYDFLPYYYPPWMGWLAIPLLPLGYPLAKWAWLVANGELLMLSGYLLRDRMPGLPRAVPVVFVPLFALSVTALLIGQVSPLILLLLVVSWRWVDQGRDAAGGCALALAMVKPQLTAVLVLGAMTWAATRSRWRIVGGFAATLSGLSLVSTAIQPRWLLAMLEAPRVTTLPTALFPQCGTAWMTVLRWQGLHGVGLWAGYLAAALPCLGLLIATARDRAAPFAHVVAWGLIAAFFVAPYGRYYDFPVLLLPAIVLVGTRLSGRAGAFLLMVLLFAPYLQIVFLSTHHLQTVGNAELPLEAAYFWIPTALALAWIINRRRPDRTSSSLPGS